MRHPDGTPAQGPLSDPEGQVQGKKVIEAAAGRPFRAAAIILGGVWGHQPPSSPLFTKI